MEYSFSETITIWSSEQNINLCVESTPRKGPRLKEHKLSVALPRRLYATVLVASPEHATVSVKICADYRLLVCSQHEQRNLIYFEI